MLFLIPNSAAVLIRDKECEDKKIASIIRAIVARYDNAEFEVPHEYRDICKIILAEVDLMVEKSKKIKERHVASAIKWRKEKEEREKVQSSSVKIETPTTEPPPKKNVASRKSKETDPEFELFYDAYGKKLDRPGAYAAFVKAKAKSSFPNIRDLIVIVSKWLQTEQWQRDGGKYQPFPATWLNREGWLDELPKPTKCGNIVNPTKEEVKEYADYF